METKNSSPVNDGLLMVIDRLLKLIVIMVLLLIALPFVIIYSGKSKKSSPQITSLAKPNADNSTPEQRSTVWQAPVLDNVSDTKQKELIEYGRELIAHTAKYLGPKGSVMQISNGLNCQNCHLDAGTKPYGNNYAMVASTYPKFRARSGSIENIYKRVNDCFERSLNGKELDSTSREMLAIKSYIEFVGSTVKKDEKPEGAGMSELAFLDRAADPEKGKVIYMEKCKNCHQADGQGLINAENTEYSFPPLWGKNSYNDAAGLYRLSNFARFVKNNMPQGSTHESPILTDEEAWDVAAFVNSQTRPHKVTISDWPDKSKKPVDHPFGPYTDGFSEKQHKYGPFKPIVEKRKSLEKTNS